jgi:DNA-binding transcriptional LysR family regulator
MYAILVGPDRSLDAALRDQGVETVRLDGHATGESLADAGVADADLLVITDVAEATAIPVARDVNPDLRVVIYSPETMPEFARGQVDLAVAPGVLDPDVIAEELANGED